MAIVFVPGVVTKDVISYTYPSLRRLSLLIYGMWMRAWDLGFGEVQLWYDPELQITNNFF